MVYRRIYSVQTHTPTRRIAQAKQLARSHYLLHAAVRKARKPMPPRFLGWTLEPLHGTAQYFPIPSIDPTDPWARKTKPSRTSYHVVRLPWDYLPASLKKPEISPIDMSKITSLEPTLEGSDPIHIRRAQGFVNMRCACLPFSL